MKTTKTTGEVSFQKRVIPLNFSPPGQWLKICTIPAGIIFTQFIRFGISEGERVQCIERLPGGTIVLQKNRQQIAVGHNLAKQVFVVIVEEEEK